MERFHAEQMGALPRLQQTRGDSRELGWEGPQIDLLFVDACHAYSCVKQDNLNWLPALKAGGIAWYHDYGVGNSMWLEVKQAVDEDLAGQEQIVRVCSSIAFRWSPKIDEQAPALTERCEAE